MSEPIIIETPAPPTRERLVLVPPGTVSPTYGERGTVLTIHTDDARDATPADLERAGWVTGEMLTEQVRIVWAAGQKVEPMSVAMLRKMEERAEKAERELAETESHAEMRARILTARAEKAERERDDLLARINQAEEAARALRAELARLTALDRATDDELVDLYRKIYETHGGGTISVSHDDCRRAALLAVAARVRQERCLVAQAAGMGADVRIEETPRNYGASFDGWTVSISTRGGPGVTYDATHVHVADVPATLARLLGEVAK